MIHCTAPRLRRQVQRLSQRPSPRPEFGLDGILDAATVESSLEREGVHWKEILYTPLLTFWAFFWQVLAPDKSCRAALKRIVAWKAGHGVTIDDEDSGPYCKARARLPESLLRRLVRRSGGAVHAEAPEDWRWCGRRVKLVDGSTVSMPDTSANQEAYPQIPGQKRGVGFPIARIVVVFCLATGVVLEAAIGRYQGKQTGENTLFRSLWEALEPGDVILGDRYYSSYFDIAMLKRWGVDCVFRLHQRRHSDFRRGRRLGRDDLVVGWRRPDRPGWMDKATYEQIPREMELRELRVRVAQRGFRTRVLVIVTTLLDSVIYAKNALSLLYRQRWHAELDLRSIKVVLGMDVRRCKTPEMVRKEIWMTLLGYNVIRALMAEAAVIHARDPRHLSFKGALQALQAFAEKLQGGSAEGRRALRAILLGSIAGDAVGNRPDRFEPRARKRRPKPYPLLNKPRKEARAASFKAS
jgi:hypothetical protein